MIEAKIKNFTDLKVWQLSHGLAIDIYKACDVFPSHENYGLSSQMRRSSVSIGSNIAEGFGRKSEKEKIQFYSVARGSASELQNQVLLARDINYIGKNEAEKFLDVPENLQKALNGLIKSIKASY